MPRNSTGFCVAIDEEELVHALRPSLDRDLLLGHHLEQRRLRARRGAVDLVGEQDVREHRPRPELEHLLLLVEDRHAEDVGGQQVGRELHAREARADRGRERLRERRLAGAGEILEQHVAAGGEGGEQPPHALVLAAHHLADVGGDAVEERLGVARGEVGRGEHVHDDGILARAGGGRERGGGGGADSFRKAGCGHGLRAGLTR